MENRDIFKLKGNKKIIAVTNRHLVKQGSLYNAVEKCCRLGADYIMVREKDLEYRELLKIAIKIKKITDEFCTPLIINGNLKAAVELKVFGFHTGIEKFKNMVENNKEDLGLLKAENIKNGVSIHSVSEAIEAEKLGADYVMAGNIFETSCKVGLKGRGLKFIDDIGNSIGIPIIAIGGISSLNIQSVLLNTKAAGAAIMSQAMSI